MEFCLEYTDEELERDAHNSRRLVRKRDVSLTQRSLSAAPNDSRFGYVTAGIVFSWKRRTC